MTATEKPATLLLVDDDPSMVRLLAKVIEKSFADQIIVETLTDPDEAVDRLQAGGIDILLTDLDMPETDGIELLRCAKDRNACTQVLFITGHSTQEALLNAIEMGASDYLLKPVNQLDLVELIGQANSRSRRWRSALAETWRQRKEAIKNA